MDLFTERTPAKPSIYKTKYTFINTQNTFDQNFDRIMRLPYWVTDTETTGLSFIHDQVILLQVGSRREQFIIDAREVDIRRLSERFEDENYRKFVQNATFDYKMMKGSFGITMEGMLDPDLGERLLTCGLQKAGFGMDSLCLKYLNLKIDKSMQTSFIGHKGDFSLQQLEYAALDCVYPDYYMPMILKRLQEANLMEIFMLECRAIPAFSDITFYGLHLNEVAWEANIKAEQAAAEIAKTKFLSLASPYAGTDLYGNPDINPNSPDQILRLFTQIYPHDLLLDPNSKDDDGNPRPGTGVEVLERLEMDSDVPELAVELSAYREHSKKSTTYGYSYIQHVDKTTNRFHTPITQIEAESGRPAGKKPNMLNIPRDKRYRVPWCAPKGRKILTNDYGACELRIMASMSGDPVMCAGFNRGVDYHTYTVTQFVKDRDPYLLEYISGSEPGKGKMGNLILGEQGEKIANPAYNQLVPYDRVTKSQREVAKTINFGLAYGMGAKKLAHKLKISLQEAREYITQFRTTFAVLVQWLQEQQEIALKRGYSLTFLGRRRYFRIPTSPKWLPEWYDLDFDPNNSFDDRMPKPLRKYHANCAAIKREGGNAPIQGGNADITKIAMYELRKKIRTYEKKYNNGEYLAHIALQVYDELVVECPEELAPMFASMMDDAMKKAGRKVILNVPVEVGCIIADTWVKG